jgi:methyltransferase OMS1
MLAKPARETTPPSSRDKRAVYIASLFGFSIALYLSTLYAGIKKDWERSQQLALKLGPNADVSDRWDAIGRNYDDEIALAEKVMLMGRKRRKLVSQAKGEVLEVSVGTGRNMQYYDLHSWGRAGEKEYHEGRVTSLTFNDKAGVMIDAAKKKFLELEGRKIPAQRFKGRVAFVVGDAGVTGAVEQPRGGFDTIVQTMGLCSTNDPVGLLRRLGELCRKPTSKGMAQTGAKEAAQNRAVEGKYWKEAVKSMDKDEDYDGGRILLLEHGRGYYNWLNNMLDGLAPSHADRYGCWWNRDIGTIVEKSGLEVEYMKRYHWGTTWELALRPKMEEEVATVPDILESKTDGLFGWMSKVLR